MRVWLGREMDLPKRKVVRLQDYDYSQCGAYFVTVCVQDGHRILWDEFCRGGHWPPDAKEIRLSDVGKIVSETINNIGKYYPKIFVDKFVTMPNHVHMILSIRNDDLGRDVEGDGRPIVGYQSIQRIRHQTNWIFNLAKIVSRTHNPKRKRVSAILAIH